MLKLTERFDLTFSVPEESDKFNIVPCLLPETKPKNVSFCRNIFLSTPFLNDALTNVHFLYSLEAT
jgi:hypothetical protein